MRAGRVNSVTPQGDNWRGTGGKGAAVAPVMWTGASGTGHTESRSGPRRRPGASGPGWCDEGKAQRAQTRRSPGGKQERVPRDASGQEERGQGCGDEDNDSAVQYEADDRLAASTVRGGVDGEEEPRCTKSTRRAREQWGWRARVAGEAATGLRAQARYHVCKTMFHKPEPKPSQPPAVRGYEGPGLVGVRAEVARMQADAAPQPPSPAFSATSAEVSSPSSLESPETVRREGPRATGRQRGEGDAAGTGEGGDRGGQAEASGGRAQEVAARAEGQGEGQGQRAVVRQRADPFNFVDVMAGVDMGRRESVVADILEVSEDEGEGAGKMAVEGGPGQPSAPNVQPAAMKSILPEVRRQEEGKGGRGQPEAGAAGSGDSSVRAGGRGRTSKGGKGQAGTSGAGQAKGHQAGKGGKGSGRGRQWPQPQRSFRQSPPGSPPQVTEAIRAEEEREARRQQAARYEALAHVERQRRRHQPPELGPDTIYWLEMVPGKTGSGRQGGLEDSEGSTAGSPVLGCEEREGRQNRAAQRRRGTTASGRESKRGGASKVDTQAARCRAGVRDR